MKEIKVNQALTQSALYFDPDFKNVSFPELMPIFHNKHLPFEAENMFGKIPQIEGRKPGHVFFDMPKGVEYYDDGSIRINCLAIGAKSVTYGNKGPLYPGDHEVDKPMESIGNDLFTAVIEKPIPGYNFVRFFADGNDIINPLMPIGNECGNPMNFFEMYGEGFEFYELRDVPHGTVHMNNYFSKYTGQNRVCYVYTPPSYNDFSDRKYPVVYLQHGADTSEFNWLWTGKINYILDNLIAEGRAEEMIVVINNGYAMPKENPDPARASFGFSEMLVKDCIPYIDSHYNTLTDRKHRAMCGLSMGGMATQSTVFSFPEYFGSFGMFSGGTPVRGRMVDASKFFESAEKFNELFDVGYVSCGDKEGEIFQIGYSDAVRFKNEGYNIVPSLIDGWHEWNVWRQSAYEYMQLIFKK